jgi:hypothetical protein
LTKKPVTLTVAIITLLPWEVWQQIGSILLDVKLQGTKDIAVATTGASFFQMAMT